MDKWIGVLFGLEANSCLLQAVKCPWSMARNRISNGAKELSGSNDEREAKDYLVASKLVAK